MTRRTLYPLLTLLVAVGALLNGGGAPFIPMEPIAANIVMGSATIGTASDVAGAGYKFGSIFPLSQAATTVSFSWYTKGGSSVQRMTPAVYAVTASGTPSSLVAKGAEVSIASNQPAGWVTSTLPAVTLQPGSYLLALLAGPTSARASTYFTPVTNGGMWNANAYPEPSATWGTVNRENAQWSAKVTLTPIATTSPPVNQTLPTISGTPAVGQTLTATTGTWSNNPTSYGYQWSRCQPGCTTIPGATAATYTVAGADAGASLRVAVTATNAGGSATATSAQTAPVPAPPQAPVNQTPPTISGTPAVGQTLTTTTGTWTGTPPPTFTSRWQRCTSPTTCADIAGATATTYTVTSSDVGATLQVVVVATNPAGTAQSTSARTATVTATPPSTNAFGATTPGTTADSPGANFKFGSVYPLSATATLVDFTWYGRGGSAPQSFVPAIYNVDGSGNPTTLITKGVAVTIAANQPAGWVTSALPAGVTLPPGNYLLALLSGPSSARSFVYYMPVANNGVWNGNAYPEPSSTWGAVNRDEARWSFAVRYVTNTPGPPANQAPPVISGTPVAGQNLQASTGTWTNGPTSFAYQWNRCADTVCTPVTGATGTTFGLTSNDVGSRFTVTVTATNAAGSAASTSATTAVVSTPGTITIEPFTTFVIDAAVPGAIVEKAFGDLDGDGRLDAVIGTESSQSQPGGGIYWYEHPHSGNPADPWTKRTILPTGTAYEDMTTFDVDGDTRVDVVANVNGNLYWFKNPTAVTGSWAQSLIGPTFGEATMSVGDLDGDGRLDIATNSDVYFQNSPTSWARMNLGNSYLGMALLDSGSGRGRIDLVANDQAAPHDTIWYRNPLPSGGNPRVLSNWARHRVGPSYPCSPGQCPEGAVAVYSTADLNGDGRMDILIVQEGGDPSPPGGVRWFEAPVDRTAPWTDHTIDATMESTHNVRTADIDGNGALDVVTGQQDQSQQRRVAVFYNDGLGNFTLQVLSNDATHNVAVGDADGDGDVDILASPHGYFGGPHPLQFYRNGRF